MTSDPVADAFRRRGYLQASVDPLWRLKPFAHPDLDEPPPDQSAPWRAIYCGSIGAEFMHMPYPERCAWVASRMEAPSEEVDRDSVLKRIAAAELFERFIHARYVGTKRYSLEGAAGLIPLIDAILDVSTTAGVEIALIGMSHRGRLNVMTHVAGVPPSHIFAGFEDVDPRSHLGGGDVKYYQGATGVFKTPNGGSVNVHVVSNPSHLEAVDPVVMGRVRARQTRLGADGRRRVLCVTLHGDAAFAGQGIAAETLNLAGLPAHTVGGTIHVVVNNLIGFTTPTEFLHTSRYSSDAALRLSIPVFHVNGEDPDAVVRVGRMAAAYRAAFGTDVVVDLIGYRRYGHSEVEDPTSTQPLLYRKIDGRMMLWQTFAETIGASAEARRGIQDAMTASLDAALEEGRSMTKRPVLRRLPAYWDAYHGGRYDRAEEIDTGVPADRLRDLGARMTSVPAGFHTHPKVRRLLDHRVEMANGSRSVDWGMAEALALGSLVLEGIPVRFAGQDSRRGTFNNRHAVLIDTETGEERVPLQHLSEGQPFFEIHDTALSEAAALGFEYGFTRDYPDALVCWEAQFGDFANGAQIIIDQFLAAGEDKWSLLSGLVLLLPHGFEGQGPEHSSARIERFLQLAGEDNFQVCQPSTSAQYFHLLRRQALRKWRKPLIVFTPKGMLRAASACSEIGDLTHGRFQPVLDTAGGGTVRRLLVCSGKLAHEIASEKERRKEDRVAILRIEQFYPFPETEIDEAFGRFPIASEIIWVQEEPANMGALSFILPLLERAAGSRRVTSVKRSASASPATGSYKAHAIEQKALLELAFAGLT